MSNFSLNQIIKTDHGWSSVIFEANRVNACGLFMDENDILINGSLAIDNYVLRYYKNTKKIVASSSIATEYDYCALKLEYTYWICLLCKKLNKFSDSKCFCSTYSNCWSPVEPKIVGVQFSHSLKFEYHFNEDSELQIIL